MTASRPTPPLEQATAIRGITDDAIAASQLGSRVADHLLRLERAAIAFTRAYAAGESPDPSGLLSATGACRAILDIVGNTFGAVEDGLSELRVALVLSPEANAEIEAQAMAGLRARYLSPNAERSPEDPRPKDKTTSNE